MEFKNHLGVVIDINNPTFWEENPEYGDIMTIGEWKDYCEDGMFIDYDGFGYLSNGKYCVESPIQPSDYMSNKGDFTKETKKFSHIVWFNK